MELRKGISRFIFVQIFTFHKNFNEIGIPDFKKSRLYCPIVDLFDFFFFTDNSGTYIFGNQYVLLVSLWKI